MSLLSFGINPNEIAHVGNNTDSSSSSSSSLSHALSAMLPFVVAATAIAALAQPSTFTWWVFWLPQVFNFFMWFCALSPCLSYWVCNCFSLIGFQ